MKLTIYQVDAFADKVFKGNKIPFHSIRSGRVPVKNHIKHRQPNHSYERDQYTWGI